jgi:hypothetical protein
MSERLFINSSRAFVFVKSYRTKKSDFLKNQISERGKEVIFSEKRIVLGNAEKTDKNEEEKA